MTPVYAYKSYGCMTTVHPDDIEPENSAKSGGRKCLQLLRSIVYKFCDRQCTRKGDSFGYFEPNNLADSLKNCDMASQYGSIQISAIIRKFLESLNSVFQRSKVRNKAEFRMDLRQTSKHFLSAAVRIERLLMRLAKAYRGISELESLTRGVADM